MRWDWIGKDLHKCLQRRFDWAILTMTLAANQKVSQGKTDGIAGEQTSVADPTPTHARERATRAY